MPNVALVVLDTLRYDRFREYFDWLDGRRFANAYSTSHWTGSAHASMLTGRYPSEVGVTVKSREITCEEPLLYEQLSEAGYTTRVFTNNLQIHEWEGWDRGVDELVGSGKGDIDSVPDDAIDWTDREFETSGIGKYLEAAVEAVRSDRSTTSSLRYGYRLANRGHLSSTRAVANRVRSTDFGRREFLLCNVMEAHAPYYAPEPHGTGDAPKPTIEDGIADAIDDPVGVRRAYDGCAAYLSEEYRDLFAALRAEFDYVLTVSDHGELLGERGHWAHNHGLDPAITHVPLVISGDDVPSKTIDTPVSLLDVQASIAEITGLDVDSRGQSLLGTPESRPRLVEYHGLARKRLETFAEYDIRAEFDRFDRPCDGVITESGYAFETVDSGFHTTDGVTAEEAQSVLESLVDDAERQQVSASQPENVSPEVKSRLDSLGYVE